MAFANPPPFGRGVALTDSGLQSRLWAESPGAKTVAKGPRGMCAKSRPWIRGAPNLDGYPTPSVFKALPPSLRALVGPEIAKTPGRHCRMAILAVFSASGRRSGLKAHEVGPKAQPTSGVRPPGHPKSYREALPRGPVAINANGRLQGRRLLGSHVACGPPPLRRQRRSHILLLRSDLPALGCQVDAYQDTRRRLLP